MTSLTALGYSQPAVTGKPAPRFAGNVDKLNRFAQAGAAKDTALFIERDDVNPDTLVSQLRAGDNVFLTAPGGSGKTMLLAETMRRLQTQGVPSYPQNNQPTGALLMRGYADLIKFLDANQEQERVVVALDEMLTGFVLPGNVDKLKAIQAKYPNARFIATQDRFGANILEADSDEDQFVNGTFNQRHELQHQSNWFAQLDRALTIAGFSLPDGMRGGIEAFLTAHFVPNNLGVRKYIMDIVNALRENTSRVDSDQPEEIPESTLQKIFKPDAT